MIDTEKLQAILLEVAPRLRDIGDSIPPTISKIDSDSGKDIKLRLDRLLHEQIIQMLKSTSDIVILSEEDESLSDFSLNKGLQWIIDPLDGSLNHFRGIPFSCISIAMWEGQTPLMGAIYDYHRREMFTGIVGKGAWLNDMPISVSNLEVNQAVLCTGFPTYRDYEDDSLRKFISYIQNWKKVRLLGSAALSLAYVACGRADGYIEEDIRIWDVAGGIAVAKAAGGEVYCSPSKKANFVTTAATNKKIPIKGLVK